MENQNVNVTNDLSKLKEMFSGFQKQQAQASKRKKSREEILAKYFVPRNNKETFRILPPKGGRKHIEEAFFHVIPINAAGGKKKFGIIYCPAHNDPKVQKLDGNGKPLLDGNGHPLMIPASCSLCAKNKKLLSTQDPSLRGIKKENMNEVQLKIKESNDKIYKEANGWSAKKFYIIRGIDKGAMKDGVKFWRFKHNFTNQGVLDKLLPILKEYMEKYQLDFSDPVNGTDLNITMTDTIHNLTKRVYKTISAISADGKSALHPDPIIVKQWLDDDIIWRDVYPPKKAPNVLPYEFLEMVTNGTSPYWEDTDAQNKHWVFPGHPDLEVRANTRTQNLDSDEEYFEQASDLEDEELPRVTISNITELKVGSNTDNAVNVGESMIVETNENTNESETTEESQDYNDLPF